MFLKVLRNSHSEGSRWPRAVVSKSPSNPLEEND